MTALLQRLATFILLAALSALGAALPAFADEFRPAYLQWRQRCTAVPAA